MDHIELILRTKSDLGKIEERVLVTFHTNTQVAESQTYKQYDSLCIDELACKVSYNENNIPLTRHEYLAFLYLSIHPGWIISQEELYRAVWREEPINIKGAVYSTISSLRKKLRAYTNLEYIQTISRMGYRFNKTPEV